MNRVIAVDRNNHGIKLTILDTTLLPRKQTPLYVYIDKDSIPDFVAGIQRLTTSSDQDGSHQQHMNTCEHGEHVAPKGKRFCSLLCEKCEHESKSDTGCDNICKRNRTNFIYAVVQHDFHQNKKKEYTSPRGYCLTEESAKKWIEQTEESGVFRTKENGKLYPYWSVEPIPRLFPN